MTAVPLPGPLDHEPVVDRQDAVQQLHAATSRGQLGEYDRAVIAWLSGWEPATVATLASILRRTYEAGVTAGRAEQIDELPSVARLTVHVDQLEAGLDAVHARLTDVMAALESAVIDEGTDLRTAIATALARARRP